MTLIENVLLVINREGESTVMRKIDAILVPMIHSILYTELKCGVCLTTLVLLCFVEIFIYFTAAI